jgi:hypothetical protein
MCSMLTQCIKGEAARMTNSYVDTTGAFDKEAGVANDKTDVAENDPDSR